MKQEEDESIVTNELPQPSDELTAPIEGDIVATQRSGESINNTSMQETIDTSITTAQESSRTDESTQESKTDIPTIESQGVQDEPPTIVQESPTKEADTPSDMQEESVDGLPASTNMAEYISELPTLQEEVTPQELQEEFTAVTTSK